MLAHHMVADAQAGLIKVFVAAQRCACLNKPAWQGAHAAGMPSVQTIGARYVLWQFLGRFRLLLEYASDHVPASSI